MAIKPAESAEVLAFAKVNLGLRVLHKRPDGFHELRTVFHTISLADRISVSFASLRQTEIAVEGMPDVPDNLATRAARAVLDELHMTGAVRIAIEKRIPMGAGLGGGSSDAAAILLALPALAGDAIPMSRLMELAAAIGSDVPFFLIGGAALGLGRGEELYPLPDYPSLPGLLLEPGIHVSTPDAYRALSLTLMDPEPKAMSFQESVREPFAKPLVNDFEPVVFAQYPKLAALKQQLLDAGAVQALMSGSGSSIFGLFADEDARFAAERLLTGVRFHRIDLVSRSAYRF